MDDFVETLTVGGQLMALIVRDGFRKNGVHFFTPNEVSQQLAYISHPAGREIPAHVHNPVAREVRYTQEVLFIKRGKVRVDFFDDGQNYVQSRVLHAGDVILLATGGHGFQVLEDLEMIEVKQGPYAGERDKTRFTAVLPADLKFKS